MNIANITFPKKELDQSYYNVLSKKFRSNGKLFLKGFIKANNRNYAIEKQRLSNINKYINNIYNININIYKVLVTIINSVKVDFEHKVLYIDDNDKIDYVRVVDLFRIINFGALGCNRSNILQELLSTAFKKIKLENIILDWGWI